MMKKSTILSLALLAGACAMQLNAAPGKAPNRSAIFNYLPSGFQQLGNTSIYYNVSARDAAGIDDQVTGFSILGKIGNQYYSSTYEPNETSIWGTTTYHEGAGFIAAFQVDNNAATYLNAATGTTANGVRMTADIEAQGEVAARIIYTITNNNSYAVTVSAGVYGDIMIGDNDNAPLELLNTKSGNTYGIKMKYSNAENAPLLCALFGEGVTGVTPTDDYWFGFFSSNWHANEIAGAYSNYIYPTNTNWGQSYAQYYMVENGSYDSGLGFCWKGRTIEPGGSIELSYLISVGEIDFEEPIIPDPDPEPGEDIFTYNIEAFNCAEWNTLTADHPIHIWGHYEHPYGQAGYLEYQVDDENGWHTLGELTSKEDYEFNFNISFNESRATDHVIAVRFNDGLDNYTELPGLSWIDVRSIEGFEDRVYNGEPQIFNLTLADDNFTVGENGEYTNPGTYTYYVEGDFNKNTIGFIGVDFTVDKAQAVIDVETPENVEFDGNAHGVNVVLVVGDTEPVVTYYQLDDEGVAHEIDGVPVQEGVYVAVVTVPESDFYYGVTEEVGPYQIYTPTSVKELNVVNEDNAAWYTIDGRRVAAPVERGIYIHNGKKYIVK